MNFNDKVGSLLGANDAAKLLLTYQFIYNDVSFFYYDDRIISLYFCKTKLQFRCKNDERLLGYFNLLYYQKSLASVYY